MNYQKNDISLIEKGQATPKENRIYYLDNLRPFMIFLVVLYHAGGVFESSGIWSSFWRIDDPSTHDLASFNKCIYLLGNKNIFEPKKLRYLQRIGKNEASKKVVICSFPIIGHKVVLSAIYR